MMMMMMMMEKNKMRMTMTMKAMVMMNMIMMTTSGVQGTLTSDLRDDAAELEDPHAPRHVHLSLGAGPDQVKVTWATRSPCATSQLTFGTSPWRLELKVAGSSAQFTGPVEAYGPFHVHRATMTGLQGGVTYYYRPVCNRIGAGPFYFQCPYANTDWSPQVLVTGDLGADLQLLPLLSQRALSGQYSATLQLGGLSEFFTDHNDTSGEQMMHELQQTAAYLPFMTSPGDYESDGEEVAPFKAYSQLFSMPGDGSSSERISSRHDESTLWYSFHLGPVHFISICTAVYLHRDLALQERQKRWLEGDLEEANRDRQDRPWVVVFGRHPTYCSAIQDQDQDQQQQDQDCDLNLALIAAGPYGLEELFYKQGVDLILQSSYHINGGYRRLYPLYRGLSLSSNFTNPPSPVHLVLGTASSSSSSSSSPIQPSPSPSLVTASPSSAREGGESSNSSDSSNSVSGGGGGGGDDDGLSGGGGDHLKDGSLAAVEMVNGTTPTFGRLHVINATHARWELLSGSGSGAEGQRSDGSSADSEVLDSFWLVQENHGPFHLSDLPKDVEEMIDHQQDKLPTAGGGFKPSVLNGHSGTSSDSAHPLGDLLHSLKSHRRVVVWASVGAVGLALAIFVIVCAIQRQRRRGGGGASRGNQRGLVPRRWDTTDYKYGRTKLTNDIDDDDDDDDDVEFKAGADERRPGGGGDDRWQTRRLIDRS